MATVVVAVVIGKLWDVVSREASSTLTQEAKSFFTNEAKAILAVDGQILQLQDKLEWLQVFLIDADQKRKNAVDSMVKVWVKQIREVAHDIEDVLDHRFLMKLGVGKMVWYRRFISFGVDLRTWHDMAHRIEAIQTRLKDISANKSAHLQSVAPSTSSVYKMPPHIRRNDPRNDDVDSVVGFEDHAKTLKMRLIARDNHKRSIICISGMAGIGKTTLANLLYNDESIKEHFDCPIWAVASQAQNTSELVNSILRDATGLSAEVEEDAKKVALSNHLEKNNKKYLVVVDDIREDKDLDELVSVFPERSSVAFLVTTRHKGIADSIHDPYQLKLLDSHSSWKLFCLKAFGDPSSPKHLEALKEVVLLKCGSLPLSIVATAEYLRRRRQPSDSLVEWENSLNQSLIRFRGEEDPSKKMLALEFDDLPLELRPCFLYLSAFPENYGIDAPELQRLWVAEGFIQRDKKFTMEERAEKYLLELIDRYMVHVVDRDELGCVTTVRVNKHMFDLARDEAEEVSFMEFHDDSAGAVQNPTAIRRLSLHNGVDNFVSGLSDGSMPKLRSLLARSSRRRSNRQEGGDAGQGWGCLSGLLSLCGFLKEPAFTFHGAKLLRVIDLQDNKTIKRLPEEIGDFIQLRYLGLRSVEVLELPSSTGKLRHLETLDTRGTSIEHVPAAFWKIKTLRHVLFHFEGLKSEPQPVFQFIHLQTFEGPSGSWVQKGGLKMMKFLRRLRLDEVSLPQKKALEEALLEFELLISLELEGESLPRVFAFANILPNLQYLRLLGKLGEDSMQQPFDQILPKVTVLSITRSNLVQDDIELLKELPNLKFLTFSGAYPGKELEISGRGFSQLEEWRLLNLTKLEKVMSTNEAMPRLKRLIIKNCPKLKALSEGLEDLLFEL